MNPERKKTNLRMTLREASQIAAAARSAGVSTNRFVLEAVAAYIDERATTGRLETLIADAMRAQTSAIVDALSHLTAAHDAQDEALRDDLRSSLRKVLTVVQIPSVQSAISAAAVASHGSQE